MPASHATARHLPGHHDRAASDRHCSIRIARTWDRVGVIYRRWSRCPRRVGALADAIRESRIATQRLHCLVDQRALAIDPLLHRGATKAVRRSSTLLPLLQRPLRDLQPQRRLALREIFPSAPGSQSRRECVARSFLMLKMSRAGSVCHSPHAIRDSRIATRLIERSKRADEAVVSVTRGTAAWLAGSGGPCHVPAALEVLRSVAPRAI